MQRLPVLAVPLLAAVAVAASAPAAATPPTYWCIAEKEPGEEAQGICTPMIYPDDLDRTLASVNRWVDEQLRHYVGETKSAIDENTDPE